MSRVLNLDLIANLTVGRQVFGFDPAFTTDTRSLYFGLMVFRLLSVVHQFGGLPRDLPPEFRNCHQVAVSRTGVSISYFTKDTAILSGFAVKANIPDNRKNVKAGKNLSVMYNELTDSTSTPRFYSPHGRWLKIHFGKQQ